jgi:hypothetical protein
MPHIFYHIANCPPNLCDESTTQSFRGALPAWRKLGLGPIVDRVDGNGVLHREDSGRMRLCVWPEFSEFNPPLGDATTIEIDDELAISWHGEKQPGPEDLDNGNPLKLSVIPLILADGEVWQIPEIREASGSLLPTDLTRDRKTGRLLNPIKKEYQSLWEECEYWFDLKWQALTGEVNSFVLERALEFATQILSLRYRFCDATQSALRVIDSVNVQTIIEIAIGWPAVLERIRQITNDEAQKKRIEAASAENLNGSSGQRDSGPITGQPAENNGS